MGNQTARNKEKEKEFQSSVARSPIRNRVFSSSNKDDEINLEFCDEKLSFNDEMRFYVDMNSKRRYLGSSNIARSISETALNENYAGPEIFYTTYEEKDNESERKTIFITPRRQTKEAPKAKPITKTSRRRLKSKLERTTNQAECTIEDSQDINPDERRNQNRREKREALHSDLVVDILNTIIKLESSLLDEQKYEQRLRKRLTDQIESIQHLSLALSTEKDRNKRLMTLLNNYDEPEFSCDNENEAPNVAPLPFGESLLTKPRDELEKYSKKKSRICISAREELSYRDHSSISPLHMEQCYDELSKSYAKCQAELRKKSKLLSLAVCKQETLQARCDKLTEEFFKSQKYIETMREKFTSKNRKIKRSKFKTLNRPLNFDADKFEEEEQLTSNDIDMTTIERVINQSPTRISSSNEALNEKGKELNDSRSARKTKAE